MDQNKNKKTEKQNQENESKKIDSEKFIKEIEFLKEQVDDFKNKYLRALADYQNLEKRVNEEKINIIINANRQLVVNLLPFIDILDKAELFVKDPGLRLAKDHLFKVLNEIGLEEIIVLNKEFDPYTAEVVEMIKGDKDNIVVEVLRKGYKINNAIIRVAQVKVSKKINS